MCGVAVAVPGFALLDQLTAISAPEMVGLAVGLVLGLGVAPLALAEIVRHLARWRRRRLLDRLAVWLTPIRDRRWRSAVVLLEELRGASPSDDRAAIVYDLAHALASGFHDLARIQRPLAASEALGGAGALAALAQQRNAAIDDALSRLPDLCAASLHDTGDAVRGAQTLLRELHARLDAAVEVGGYDTPFSFGLSRPRRTSAAG